VWLGYDWPSPVKIVNPNLEFYFEEAVREFNESGHWFAHFFGILGAGEIKIPPLFLYINLFSFFFLIVLTASKRQVIRVRQYFVFCIGLFFFPAGIQLANSASWPVWWQGRYSLPVFLGLFILHLSSENVPRLNHFIFISILTHVYLVSLTFARFNWGLYPTSTPMVANGWALSNHAILVFIFSFFIYLFLTLKSLGIRSYFTNSTLRLIKILID